MYKKIVREHMYKSVLV